MPPSPSVVPVPTSPDSSLHLHLHRERPHRCRWPRRGSGSRRARGTGMPSGSHAPGRRATANGSPSLSRFDVSGEETDAQPLGEQGPRRLPPGGCQLHAEKSGTGPRGSSHVPAPRSPGGEAASGPGPPPPGPCGLGDRPRDQDPETSGARVKFPWRRAASSREEEKEGQEGTGSVGGPGASITASLGPGLSVENLPRPL